MPKRPGKQCCQSGCAGIAYNARYCNKHSELNSGWARYQQGKSDTQRGYGWSWRKLRKIILKRDNHLCQEHGRQGKTVPASMIDHITPKRLGGTDSEDNLESICRACHESKTQAESKVAQHG